MLKQLIEYFVDFLGAAIDDGIVCSFLQYSQSQCAGYKVSDCSDPMKEWNQHLKLNTLILTVYCTYMYYFNSDASHTLPARSKESLRTGTTKDHLREQASCSHHFVRIPFPRYVGSIKKQTLA